MAALSLTLLGAARALTPSPAGIGTHTQLGLPPCAVWAWLHVPCPTCGLTTAVAHLMRGQLLPSLRAHPAGLPFALALSALAARALWSAHSGRSPAWLFQPLRLRAALWFVLTLGASWVARLAA